MQARDGDEAIPPVVARIFSGDSTSPLTRDERMWCGTRVGCTFEMIVGMAVFGATGGNPSVLTAEKFAI